MEDNLKFYNKMKSVPKERLKKITAGRLKGMSDINPQWRIEKLTETFWPCWIGWRISEPKYTYETYWNEIVCNCHISLYIKIDSDWSEAIPWVWGSRFATNEKNWVYVSDESEKMALTDAISVASKMLWLASDIYMWLSDSKYSDQIDWQWETKSPTDILKEKIENAKDIGELLWYKDEIEKTCVSDKQREFFRNIANAAYKKLNKPQEDGEDLSLQQF